jgi:hypothetical protein
MELPVATSIIYDLQPEPAELPTGRDPHGTLNHAPNAQ